MGRFWNKDTKRFAFLLATIILLGMVFLNGILLQFRGQVKKASRRVAAGMIGVVLENYPDVPEEQVIRSFQEGKAADRFETDGSWAEHSVAEGNAADRFVAEGNAADRYVADGNRSSARKNEQVGNEILARYGILEDDFVMREMETAERLFSGELNFAFLLESILLSVCFLAFWYARNRKLSRICLFVNKVCEGDYGMDIRDNQEDELSGLKNELYKLTVLCKEQARQANAGKEALAESVANISHQLKTPLTSAVVLADNLVESPDMDEEMRRKFLSEISRQLVGMKWLVLTLLKLSRMDAGMVEFKKETVSLKNVVETVIQNLGLTAEWKNIHFETRLQDCVIQGDEKWLTEAVQNIVKNAVEHSKTDGTVEVETQENALYAQVLVRDHGPGISEMDQKHLFERFFSASKVENENVGIGLALAKEIVERQGGLISVDSNEQGTVFYLKFLKK